MCDSFYTIDNSPFSRHLFYFRPSPRIYHHIKFHSPVLPKRLLHYKLISGVFPSLPEVPLCRPFLETFDSSTPSVSPHLVPTTFWDPGPHSGVPRDPYCKSLHERKVMGDVSAQRLVSTLPPFSLLFSSTTLHDTNTPETEVGHPRCPLKL